jgi:hypothetical protein
MLTAQKCSAAASHTNGAEQDDTDWTENTTAAFNAAGPKPARNELSAFDISRRQRDQLRNDFGRFLDDRGHVAGELGWRPDEL